MMKLIIRETISFCESQMNVFCASTILIIIVTKTLSSFHYLLTQIYIIYVSFLTILSQFDFHIGTTISICPN